MNWKLRYYQWGPFKILTDVSLLHLKLFMLLLWRSNKSFSLESRLWLLMWSNRFSNEKHWWRSKVDRRTSFHRKESRKSERSKRGHKQVQKLVVTNHQHLKQNKTLVHFTSNILQLPKKLHTIHWYYWLITLSCRTVVP